MKKKSISLASWKCRFLHKWSVWKRVTWKIHGENKAGKPTVTAVTKQHKMCVNCNLEQVLEL